MSCSISNRLESPRGVVMKVIRTLETSRLANLRDQPQEQGAGWSGKSLTGRHCSRPSPASVVALPRSGARSE